jgi:hypothetical protein
MDGGDLVAARPGGMTVSPGLHAAFGEERLWLSDPLKPFDNDR